MIYDNRIYRSKKLSYQYHAFATSLLGEIYLETKKKFYLKRFSQAINFLKEITSKPSKFNKKGLRGYKQIAGYAAAIHALTLGHIILKDEECLKNAKTLFNHLKKFQRKDGSFPLVLTKEEYNLKKYKDGEILPYWESYNRLYDYLGFLALYLSKTVKLIQET